MACVNMYNPEHHHHQSSSFLSAPRISFSSDFALEPPPPPQPGALSARSPGDADFEFSVGSHPMMAADQLFSKGRLLPLREAPLDSGADGGGRPMTLRDELRADSRNGRVPRAPNRRWKELLGLKKAPKKHPPADATDAAAGTSSPADAHMGGTEGSKGGIFFCARQQVQVCATSALLCGVVYRGIALVGLRWIGAWNVGRGGPVSHSVNLTGCYIATTMACSLALTFLQNLVQKRNPEP
ncbi:hypothetical protein ABZP36_033667 [Zizania latifolia]